MMQALREIFYPVPQEAFREEQPHESERMFQILKIMGVFCGFVPVYFGFREYIGTQRAFTIGVGAALLLSRTVVKYFTRALAEP